MARKKKVKKNCGIYMILNLVNNKKYIGQSIDIEERWDEHIRDLRANRHGIYRRNKKLNGQIGHLQHAWNKYGSESFEWIILKFCNLNKLNHWEKIYVDRYNSFNPHCGYNEKPGGDCHVCSDEIKSKISKTLTGRKRTEESRRKQSESTKGRKPSPQCIEAGRKVNTGRKHTEEQKKRHSEIMTGYKHTEEAKKKIGKAGKGKKHTEQSKKNMSIGCKNKKKQSLESREKMKQTLRKYKHLVDEWKELRRQGLKYSEIGERYNIAHETIRKYLLYFYPEEDIVNIKTEDRKYLHLLKEWQELYKQGVSFSEIGRRYNVNRNTVSIYLNNYLEEFK